MKRPDKDEMGRAYRFKREMSRHQIHDLGLGGPCRVVYYPPAETVVPTGPVGVTTKDVTWVDCRDLEEAELVKLALVLRAIS